MPRAMGRVQDRLKRNYICPGNEITSKVFLPGEKQVVANHYNTGKVFCLACSFFSIYALKSWGIQTQVRCMQKKISQSMAGNKMPSNSHLLSYCGSARSGGGNGERSYYLKISLDFPLLLHLSVSSLMCRCPCSHKQGLLKVAGFSVCDAGIKDM